MRTVIVRDAMRIPLGKQGENNAVRVVWPEIAEKYAKLYGEGRFELVVVQRGQVYPAVVNVDGADLVWDVRAADTATAEVGSLELIYYVGDTIAKSQTWETVVVASASAAGTTEPPEDPARVWFDEIKRQIGDLGKLTTKAKENLVGAINEAAQTSSGGADWAQNDPTAKDYVKNRTHYRSIDKATVTVKAGEEGILADMVPFEPGDVVDITVNGEEMSMTAASDTISAAGQSREFVYVGDSPSGVISGTVKYGWCVYTAIDMGLCAAIALKADCTIEYSAYVYTRLPMEYSPITLETDVNTESGAIRQEYIKISNVIIDNSISYSDYPIAVTRTDDTGQTELVITGEHNSYRPVLKEVGINLICEPSLNQDVSYWIIDPDKNLKEFFNKKSSELVQFSLVEIDGIKYEPFLQMCSRGLYGTLAALNGSVYAVTVDFGSTVKAEWFDNKWKIVIKKIG